MSRKRKHKNARMKKQGILVLGNWGGRLLNHLGKMVDAYNDYDCENTSVIVSTKKSKNKKASKDIIKKEESVIPKFEICPTKMFKEGFD